MQRGSYAPPPAHSPPLHHPVPQHVSTVPMMRSPPPPQSQSTSNYGSPYNGQVGGGGGTFAPAFGGFINDPTAQMGYQVGKTALNAGQEYMEQNVYSAILQTLRILSAVVYNEVHSILTSFPDKPLRLHLSSKTLLQRLHPLRPPQTPPRPLSMAA